MGSEEDDEFEEDDEEWDCEVAWLANLANDAPAAEGDVVDEDIDYDPGNLLSKVLTLVNQIRVFFSILNHMLMLILGAIFTTSETNFHYNVH